MMTANPEHRAPKRTIVRAGPLLAGLLAGPAAWILQLVTAYGLSSFACDPRGLFPLSPAIAMADDRPILLGFNLLCLAVAVVGGLVSLQGWRRTLGEKARDGRAVIDPGEGRTRFLAVCGVLSAMGFTVAILFNTFEFFSVPSCWSATR